MNFFNAASHEDHLNNQLLVVAKISILPVWRFEKMPIFEVKLWANGKRTRLHFWMRESSNCVEHKERENLHFPKVPFTFLRLGCYAPKFRQTCTILQNSWFCDV